MSDTLSDAEKIRNKRLAKLGNPTPPPGSPSDSPSNSPNTSRPQSPAPQQQSPRVPCSPTSTAQTPLYAEGKRIKITPAISTPERPSSAASSVSTSRPTRSENTAKAEPQTIEEFEHQTLGELFKLSLVETPYTTNGKRIFLPGLRSELQDEGKELRLQIAYLDQALLEAASNTKQQRPLDYLLPCWKDIQKKMKKPENDPKKSHIYNEAQRLCLSYCIFAITMPEMFGVDSPEASPLARHLLLDPDDSRGLDAEFLREVVKSFDEDEAIKPALITAIEELSSQLSTKDANGDYQPYLMALRNIVQFSPLAVAITESSIFNHSKDPSQFEKVTLLGPWFRLSPLQPDVTMSFFSSPKTRDQAYILNAQRSLRMTQHMIKSELERIVHTIVRASPEARERLLDWFATAVNINHKRRAMQVDPEQVSSDGFMFNITSCLDHLCEPIMNASFSKVNNIEAAYLQRNPRVDMEDETKINADKHASDAFYSKKVEGKSNFTTEVVFLSAAAHHYGSESLTSKLEQLEKDLRHMESTITKFELERHRWTGNPMQLRVFEQALKKYRDKLDLGLALKYSLQGVLFDEQWQTRSILFMRHLAVWLLKLVSGADFPKEKVSLPLPEKQPEVFQCLPEYFLDVIVSNFKFIMWAMPQIITATEGDELVMLCISFLESSSYIKNPYLKAGLVSILFRGTWDRPGGARGVLVDLLNSLPFANQYLLHAVMRFYIEAEHTGAHTQFFDKFNIRYEIFQIIKCIWPNTLYRKKLSYQANQNVDFFVQFVNLLLNDVTYVLDESFGAFKTIHNIQDQLASEGNSMDPTTRQEREEHLTTVQRSAKSYMQLTNETMAMLKLFTAALADAFTMPEIVQRLADMLNYNLEAMAGPKSSNLKVENPGQYGFEPKVFLSEIARVYLNLMGKETFITAIARDGRSYKPVLFEKAAVLLRNHKLTAEEDLQRWDRLRKKVQEAKEADDQAEEDLGEVPDEFLDPLMYTLIEDPVILPSSRVSIDRSTIRSHLLSDPHDPFNRVPLKMEDVLPDTELKAKIEAFKAERTGKKSTAGEQMDISAD